MAEQHFYDTTDGSWLTWRPLADNSSRMVTPGLGREAILRIGAFGTCGDPSADGYSSWRTTHLLPAMKLHGVEGKLFNPEVEKWTPSRGPIESVNFARNAVIAVPVTNQTDGHASIREAGFAAYGGALRGQDVFVSIDDDENSPPETRVARRLARSVLTATAAQYPLFSLVDNLEVLSQRAAISLAEKIRRYESGVEIQTEYTLPPIRGDLDPTIYLSGTSGRQKPEWMKRVAQTIEAHGISVDDSYRDDWDTTTAADEELMHKLGNAVHLIAITSETDSLGALAEIGPRLMYADLAGQSLGIYIEPHDSKPSSATNRGRILTEAHLSRLRDDFPNLPVFLANNLDELAIFGMSEHFRQRQRMSRQ